MSEGNSLADRSVATAIAGGIEDIDQIARYLTLDFGGYFMNRIATDPDPSDDPYGTSGYTMALADEPVLDQVIRLQPDPVAAPLRKNPLPHIQVGVTVNAVSFDGRPDAERTAVLSGAKVELLGSPCFVSTNNTVGSDDTMAFVVEPFHLRMTHSAPYKGKHVPIVVDAEDYLVPDHPDIRAVQIPQPTQYARRLTKTFEAPSDEAHQSIGVYDEYGYFRDRRRWLKEQIEKTDDATEKQCYLSRLFQIETWGDRFINKLGFKASWSHRTNATQSFNVNPPVTPKELLHGEVIENQPWAVDYWFGAWDGDLLVGYMKGQLKIPFVPS